MRLAIALVLGGCFSPDYGENFPCGAPPDECPSDYTCVGGVCKKSDGVGVDAPIGMTVDAPPPETGPLRVKVYRPDNTVAVGVTVVFHDPQGRDIAVTTTDGNGETRNDITTGGAVTAAFFNADLTPNRLRTVGGLSPNRTLQIGKAAVEDPLVLTAMVSPPGSPPGGTALYVYEAGTGGCTAQTGVAPPGPVPLPIRQHCVATGATYNVIVYATDGAGKRLAFSAARGVSTATTAVTLPPFQTTFTPFQINLANAPEATSAPCFTDDAGSLEACAGSAIDAYVGGVGFRPDSGKSFPLLPLGSTTLSYRLAPGFFDTLRYQVSIPYGPTGADGAALYLHQVVGVPANDPVDLGAVLPPRVRDARVDAGTVPFVLRFDADASPTGMDAFAAELGWRSVTDAGSPSFRRWLMLLPPGTSSPVRFPELPSELSAFIDSGVTVEDVSAFFIDFSTFDGYDASVNELGTALFDDDGIPPGTITVRASGVFN
jgi:hypothetical protein